MVFLCVAAVVCYNVLYNVRMMMVMMCMCVCVLCGFIRSICNLWLSLTSHFLSFRQSVVRTFGLISPEIGSYALNPIRSKLHEIGGGRGEGGGCD